MYSLLFRLTAAEQATDFLAGTYTRIGSSIDANVRNEGRTLDQPAISRNQVFNLMTLRKLAEICHGNNRYRQHVYDEYQDFLVHLFSFTI